jgi:CRISPR/Cas system Type II protein with McrA/HNH and RuvC-like nuclease domain
MTVAQRAKAKQNSREWSRRNHDRRKIHMATHKLKRLAKGQRSATGRQLLRLWRKQHGRCALTRVPLTFLGAHLDHIVPTSKGGSQTIENLRWTHPMANAAKGTRSDQEFWAWLEQVIANYKRSSRWIAKAM